MLYATALISHMFTNEGMREGSVEPKESKGKKALHPTKISLIEIEYPLHNVLLKFVIFMILGVMTLPQPMNVVRIQLDCVLTPEIL